MPAKQSDINKPTISMRDKCTVHEKPISTWSLTHLKRRHGRRLALLNVEVLRTLGAIGSIKTKTEQLPLLRALLLAVAAIGHQSHGALKGRFTSCFQTSV